MSKVAETKDYDLKKAWDDACDAFARTSGEELKVKTKYTPEEVLEQIRAKQEKDEEKAAKYRVAKDVLSKTLDCIDNLGNIAAQGASMVFGPAGFAGNALSYLIATGAKYKYIFNSLAELFTKISNFLERFKIYFRMPDVDISLRVIINELLICFVSICGLSIKILKGNKALLYLKVFAFSDDAGVNAKLAELAALVEKEREMRATLSYEVDKTIERSVNAGRVETKEGLKALNSAVNEMAEQEKKREVLTTQAKQLDAIEKALNKPSDSYKSIYQNYMDKKVEGTGEWLLQNSEYSAWAKQGHGTSSILCLAGGEGYGKSFLMSIAIQDLRRRFPPGDNATTRTSIAYYYFQRESKSSKSEKDVLSLSTALKSLALQIAKLDIVYRKELHASCESLEDSQVAEMWNKLFEPAYKHDATFYLILDGVDQMEEKHVKAFASILQQALKGPSDVHERGPLCLRILLSGRNKNIEELTAQSSATVIDVATNNSDDIRQFVRDSIAEIKILDGSTPAAQSRRDEIFEAITKHAKGDFISVDLLLKQIAEKRRVAEMLEVLEQFQGENRSDTIARSIEDLNKTLSRQDIVDLNELLAWVICGYQDMTLAELETVLRLKNGEDNYSLQPLAESIAERYSKLLAIDGEPDPVTKKIPLDTPVMMTSSLISDYFLTMGEKDGDEDSNEPLKANRDGDVNESEVKIVRRFLESVCDPELFQRFRFEQFFQAKLTMSTAIIHFDVNDSHLRIVSACVDVLCSENELWNPLMDYIHTNFRAHLWALDLSLVLPQDKMRIGAKLVRCFSDEKIIARWWNPDELWGLRWAWVISNSYIDAVLNWFKDSAVVKGLNEEGKNWAKDLTSNSRPDADLSEHVAKFVAEKWLSTSFWPLGHTILFVHSFVSKIETRADPKRGNGWQDIDSPEDIPIEDLQLMSKWVKNKLNIEELGYEESRNLARTYRECGHRKEAIEMFKQAATLKEDNWLCLWSLSVTYGADENWPLAIETLQGVMQSIKNGTAKDEDPAQYLPEMRKELAQYTKKSGDTESAIVMYQNIITENPDDFDTAYELLTYLHETKRFALLNETINNMKISVNETFRLDRWTLFYHCFTHFGAYHESIMTIAYESDSLLIFKEGYETAIEAAKTKQKELHSGAKLTELEAAADMIHVLIYWCALFLYRTQCVPGATATAISLWEQVLGNQYATRRRRTSPHWSVSFTQSELPFAYLALARTADRDSNVVAEILEKLRKMSIDVENELTDITSPKRALSRYFSLIGKKEEAKEAMKSEVKINLELLSDDDSENDWQGYQGLAICLMYTGEFDHARAAWSLVTPTEVDGKLPDPADHVSLTNGDGTPEIASELANDGLQAPETNTTLSAETSSKDSETSAAAKQINGGETAKQIPGPMGATCDGRCGTEWQYSDGWYTCLDCDDIQFCSECLPKQRAGTLSRRVCNKDHEMFQTPYYNVKRLNEIGKGNVDVVGTIMPVKDWLDDIKKLWNLE